MREIAWQAAAAVAARERAAVGTTGKRNVHRSTTARPGTPGTGRAHALAALGLALVPALLASGTAELLPFSSGERLSYSARAGPGMNGGAEMWIEGPVEVRGVRAIALHSEVTGGFGPFKVSNKSVSWLDPNLMGSLRFSKAERSPLGKHHEEVEIDPATRNWRAADGRSGTSPSNQPLDELSFIYMLRTIQIPADSTLVLNRHFDADRNPTKVRSLGRSSVDTPAGTFATHDVEMRVRDARRYRGEGVIKISLSDDPCRRPVRIECTIPNAGRVVMTLTAASPAIPACAPR